jgi:archaellum component FlaG (FlaF/FlaG flagellin family)
MIILLNTDNNLAGSEELSQTVEELISKSLDRFAEHTTRVEVHLTDENSHKPGESDKRCVLEARLEGMHPIAVSDNGDTHLQTVKRATDKLKAALDTAIGRLKKY